MCERCSAVLKETTIFSHAQILFSDRRRRPADRYTKWLIPHRLTIHDSITVIPGFFRIIHTENPGAAFGIFADSPTPWKIAMLILFSVVALVIVSVLLWKSSHAMTSTGKVPGLALILGGALGNLGIAS